MVGCVCVCALVSVALGALASAFMSVTACRRAPVVCECTYTVCIMCVCVCVWMVKSPPSKKNPERLAMHSFGRLHQCCAATSSPLCFPWENNSLSAPPLSTSDNISIQALFSAQTAMSYLAARAHRINC